MVAEGLTREWDSSPQGRVAPEPSGHLGLLWPLLRRGRWCEPPGPDLIWNGEVANRGPPDTPTLPLKSTNKTFHFLTVISDLDFHPISLEVSPKNAKCRNAWTQGWSVLSYLFQWVLELRYKDGNMMGRILAALSLIRLMMYSLFQ